MLLVFHRSEHLNRICSIVEMSSGEIHLDFHSMAISKWEFYKYEILFCVCVLGVISMIPVGILFGQIYKPQQIWCFHTPCCE